MSENSYRRAKVILLGVAVVGSLIIGWRWSENGRYQQIDWSKTRDRIRPLPIMDTRTGEINEVGWKD